MIKEVTAQINEALKTLFDKYPGKKIYGITQPMERTQGTETEIIPCEIDSNGEGTYVGIDDTAPLIVYHKLGNAVASTPPPVRSGYGDGEYSVNTFSGAMIVYFDRKVVTLMPDELFFYIQGALPTQIKLSPFKNIRILFQNVILNSQAVYQSEYQNGQTLDPGKSMIAINYQIESTFSKDCFATC